MFRIGASDISRDVIHEAALQRVFLPRMCLLISTTQCTVKGKVKLSRHRPGEALGVPGG
jgi:hypothetical protein